jgi:hypothetical protein
MLTTALRNSIQVPRLRFHRFDIGGRAYVIRYRNRRFMSDDGGARDEDDARPCR